MAVDARGVASAARRPEETRASPRETPWRAAARAGVGAPRRAFLWQISPRLQREGCDVVFWGRVRLRSGEDGTRDGVGAGMRVGARRPCQLPAGCHVLTSCGKVTSTARARTRGAARGGSRARGLGLVRIREGAKRRGRVEARRVEGSAPPTLGTPASRPARNSRRFAHLCSRKPASRRALAPPGAPRPDELTSPSFTWNRGRGATDISPHVFALPAPPRRRTPPGGCSRGFFLSPTRRNEKLPPSAGSPPQFARARRNARVCRRESFARASTRNPRDASLACAPRSRLCALPCCDPCGSAF